jgi:hypothetical protein
VLSWHRSASTGALGFVALACAIVGLLLRDALLRGHVLSQAQLLAFHYPWRAHWPPGSPPWPATPLLDVPTVTYPFAAFFREAMRHGEFPLWANGAGAGFPFLATFQSALLSPFTWLALVVPLPEWTVVSASLRLLTGGLGMFVFARRLGLSAGAATVGGVSYLLNPFTVLWLEHPLAGVPPWMPWLLVAADAAARGGWRPAAGLAVTTGLVLGGGHPHTGAAGFLLGALYALFAAGRTARPWPALARVSVGLALGLALVAVQVLPFLEYLSMSRLYLWRNSYALNPFHQPLAALPTLLLPQLWGHPDAGNYIGPSNYLEQTLYVGVPTLLLAAAALTSRSHRATAWFFAGVATVALLVIMGTPGLLHLISVVPLLKAASLPRFMIVATTCAAALAAIGAERLREGRRASRPHDGLVLITVATVGFVIACGAILAIARDSLITTGVWTFAVPWALWAVLLAAATLAAAVLTVKRPGLFRGGSTLLVALVTMDLLAFAWNVHRPIPADLVFPAIPELRLIDAGADLTRVVGTGTTLLPNTAMVYGLQDARSYDGLDVRHVAELLAGTFGTDVRPLLKDTGPFTLLNLLSVRYVITEPGVHLPDGWFERINTDPVGVYRNTRLLPRAFLVDAWQVVDDATGRDLLQNERVDSRRRVLLASPLAAGEQPERALEGAADDVSIVRYANNVVDLDVSAGGRRLLVLSDTHFPGWDATIDGQPATVHRANVAFRAVSVPQGHHRVQFRYRPRPVLIGGLLSAAALAVVLALARRRGAT